MNVLLPAVLLFMSLTVAAAAVPARPPSPGALFSEFAAAIEGKAKKPKKKKAASRKPAKAPLPQPRPEALTAKPASATEAKAQDDKAQDEPAEVSSEAKPKDIAKVPVPQPRPASLDPAAEAKKTDDKNTGKTEKAAEKPTEAKPSEEKKAPGETTSAEPPEAETDIAEVPLPVPRPKNIKPDYGPHPPAPGLVEAEVPNDPLPDPVCDELETKGEVEFERLPRIMEGQCGALTPIRLKAFTPKEGPKVTLENPATVTCKVAATALDWMKTSVQPAAIKHLGGTIRALRQTGGYECRGRNRDPHAKMSEHGTANALDIGGFERINEVVVPVSDKGEAELAFLMDIRKEACGPFTTVLGPGVAAHEEHFHLDLAKRGKDGRTTYCR